MGDVDALGPPVAPPLAGQEPGPEVEVLEDVVGDVADGEEQDQDDQQLHASLRQHLVGGVCPAEDHEDVSVAAQREQQRDAEAHQRPPETVPEVVGHELPVRGVKALLCVLTRGFGVEHVRQALDPHQQPGGGGDERRVGEGDASHGPQRVDDGQVAVDADAGEEAHAAVQVQVEAEPGHLAEGLPEDPATVHEVVDHQEGQRQQVEDVRDAQVEDKQVDVAQLLPVPQQRPEAPTVGQQPHQQHRDVNGGQEPAREVQVDARTEAGIHGVPDRNQLLPADALSPTEAPQRLPASSRGSERLQVAARLGVKPKVLQL